MILADENIHPGIVRLLREAGFAVTSIRETCPGSSDEAIIEMALAKDYILITGDNDFGEWVFSNRITILNVIFLRYSPPNFQEYAKKLIELLLSDDLVRPFFITVTSSKIRMRKL